jgi:hypothetical protein
VSTSNPQTWNRYGYVGGNPLNSIDPSGLGPNFVSGQNPVTGQTCILDFNDVPCAIVSSMLNSGAAAQCPNNDCSVFYKTFTTAIGGSFSVVEAANGLVLINNSNDMELTTGAAQEAGLFVESNPSLIPAWDFNLGNWKQGALTRLQEPKCGKFFGGKGTATINNTRYLPFGGPTDEFAETYPGSNIVWINTVSSIFQGLPGTRIGGFNPGGMSLVDAGSIFLLHETSHQLTSITGAAYDGGSSPASLGLNYWNTIRVMQACPVGN